MTAKMYQTDEMSIIEHNGVPALAFNKDGLIFGHAKLNVHVGPEQPAGENRSTGQLWLNSVTEKLSIFNGTAWDKLN